MKFCKDCKFYSPSTLHALLDMPDNSAECTHQEALEPTVNPYYKVTGVRGRVTYRYCTVMRIADCGEEAKLFQPRGRGKIQTGL